MQGGVRDYAYTGCSLQAERYSHPAIMRLVAYDEEHHECILDYPAFLERGKIVFPV